MKTLVYLVRHGESLGNFEKRFLGHADLPLTDKGRTQAACLTAYLEKNAVKPDAVYASSLSRAFETARIATGKEPISTPNMREICGGAWEGVELSVIRERYPEDLRLFNEDIGVSRPTGGESVAELSERILKTVFAIAEENAGKTVLIGTHATPVRLVETFARGLSVEGAASVPWPTNASLSAYLVGDGEVLPLFYSLDSYLGDLVTRVPRRL